MIIDWNKHNILGDFILKGSNHHFISRVIDNRIYFIDLESEQVIEASFLEDFGLDFFRIENDEDFEGVWIDL